ncbi:MAG: GTP-binding protein [Okeania sp. SIO2H7]|nr:GTP-binding protein [Okeania sp. SIO2H7]
MVGDFGVGKTSLIRRFVDRQFSDKYLSTVGVKISKKKVDLSEEKSVQLLIWDLEGHTKFKAIAPSYLQGASAAIIAADVTRQETIDNMEERLQLFLSVNPKGMAIFALNKADLIEPEQVAKLLEDIKEKQPDRVIAAYSTSAKTGENVDEMFNLISAKMIEQPAVK